MKKLLAALASIGLITPLPLTIVACNSGFDLNREVTFADKIVGIDSLTDKTLLESGVKVGNKTGDELKSVILSIAEMDENEPGAQILVQNLTIIAMANEFLFEIARKVPGYAWIGQNIKLQGTYFNIKDMFKGEMDLSSLTTKWMPTIDYLGLSVTFLDSTKEGWRGADKPMYARININHRVNSDKTGNILLDHIGINESLLWKDNNGNYEKVGMPFINPLNPSLGSIYQGFVNSSKLFNLTGISFDKEIGLGLNTFAYTPTVVDFANNTLIPDVDINGVLEKYKDEIGTDLTESLLVNQIYLSEGGSSVQINARMANQIFITSFEKILLRKEEGWTDDQMISLNLHSARYWNNVQKFIDSIDINNLNPADQAEGAKYLGLIADAAKKDSKLEVDSVLSKEVKDGLNFLLFKTRKPKEKIYELGKGIITAITGMQDYTIVQNITDLKNSNLQNYGFDDSYRLIVKYFSGSIPTSGFDNFTYEPDKGKNKGDDFISDKGFLNVSPSKRFRNLLQAYYRKLNQGSGWVTEKESIAPLSLLDLGKIKQLITNKGIDYLMDKNNDWFDELGFLRQLGITSSSQLSSANVADLASASARYTIRQLFTYDEVKKTMPIWELGLSSDVDVTGNKEGLRPGEAGFNADSREDDIAFSKIIGLNSTLDEWQVPVMVVDVDIKGGSNFRRHLKNNGLTEMENGKLFFGDLRVMTGKINIFGEAIDETNVYEWYRDPEYNTEVGKIKFFMQTSIANDIVTRDILEKYWENWAIKG